MNVENVEKINIDIDERGSVKGEEEGISALTSLTVACMGIIRVIYREPGGIILPIDVELLFAASVSLLLSVSSTIVEAFFFAS